MGEAVLCGLEEGAFGTQLVLVEAPYDLLLGEVADGDAVVVRA